MTRRRLDRLTQGEADTVDRLAALTGRTPDEILRRVNRSREDQLEVQTAVSLAVDVWDYLDGTTGQWSTDGEKQDRQLRSYAATLFTLDS